MRRSIGVTTAQNVVAGVVVDHEISGSLIYYSGAPDEPDALVGLPPDRIAEVIRDQIVSAARGEPFDAVGIGFPGIIQEGIIQDSPNLHQVKGCHMRNLIASKLSEAGLNISVNLYNDADIVAAGFAATRGQLDRLIRVWTLSNGIGYGRYPLAEGVWEGGHSVVSLDPAERYCGCGGRGHLEGIMGHRAMRLRFLDMEPEEVFEQGRRGNQRCAEFVHLWHRALAAATATSIHMSGPGKFFITGRNAGYIDLPTLNEYMQEMVKMSPLQGYVFEVVPGGDEIAVIGAAVNALRGAFPA